MRRVLVLTSDANVRELRRMVLVRAGLEVEAPELNAATELLGAREYDALVVGRIEEADACRWIAIYRIRNPNGCVVAVGAQGEVRGLANSTVDPFEPSALVLAVQVSKAKRAR